MNEIAPSVVEQNLTRLRALDVREQAGIIRMVGEWKGSVHAVPVVRATVDRPSGQRRGPGSAPSEETRERFRRWRPYERLVAVERRRLVARVFGHRDSAANVRLRHGGDCRVDGDRNSRAAKDRHRFLRFAERVGEKDRHRVGFEGKAGKSRDFPGDLVARRKDVVRASERTFHKHDVATLDFGGLGRERPRQVEVARIDEPARLALHQQLRAAENVSGRK